MGHIPPAETKRDLSLIQDYLLMNESGWVYSISELGVRYARIEDNKILPLTAARIHQILNRHGVCKGRKPIKPVKK